MLPLPWKNRRRRWLCQVTAALLVFAQVGATIGFPLPPARSTKDHGQPFPCQDHPCGCRNAEECWRDCCCYSPEEKLAWARAHNVEPPAYAAKPNGGWHTARLRDQEANSCCCNPSKSACCKDKRSACGQPSRSGTGWQLGLTASRCKGFHSFWLAGGAAVSPPPRVTWTFSWTPLDWLTDADEAAIVCPLFPADPPPRFLGA